MLPNNELSADALRRGVTNYGWDEPHPDGPFKVTPVETARQAERPRSAAPMDMVLPQEDPHMGDIHRYELPQERAWGSTLVRFGGAQSGASILGGIHFDVPLNGTWS